jgi:hypothetical protein
MNIRIQGWIVALVAALFLATAGAPESSATTVSGTFTTSVGAGGISTSLFVKAGERARVQLLNTFVATWQFEVSRNNGTSWNRVRQGTATATFEADAQLSNVLYRLRASAYTSGTITYSIDNVQYQQNRVVYTNVPVGSVAYGSFGSVLAPPVAGTLYVTDIVVPRLMSATGVKVLNGATCGTDKYVAWLFDSTGLALASSALAGTTCSGTDAFQTLAFTSPVTVAAGQYLVGIRVNGTTDRTRFVAGSTFVDPVCSTTAHSSLLVGSFGSSIYGIPVPTAFTAGQCPIVQVYGSNAP